MEHVLVACQLALALVRECLVHARLGTKYVVARIADVKILEPGTAK